MDIPKQLTTDRHPNPKREQMSIEEAIDLLDNLIGMIDDNHGNDYDTALKMAIKALEESVTDNDT